MIFIMWRIAGYDAEGVETKLGLALAFSTESNSANILLLRQWS